MSLDDKDKILAVIYAWCLSVAFIWSAYWIGLQLKRIADALEVLAK
jgi:hypothetical protein